VGAGAAQQGLDPDALDVGGLGGGIVGLCGAGADDLLDLFFFLLLLLLIILLGFGGGRLLQGLEGGEGGGGRLDGLLPLLELEVAGGDVGVEDGAGEVGGPGEGEEGVLVAGDCVFKVAG
jgi:hypothetical protein